MLCVRVCESKCPCVCVCALHACRVATEKAVSHSQNVRMQYTDKGEHYTAQTKAECVRYIVCLCTCALIKSSLGVWVCVCVSVCERECIFIIRQADTPFNAHTNTYTQGQSGTDA